MFLLCAAVLLAGCSGAGQRGILPPAEEELLLAKGDPALLDVVRGGGTGAFAALAVFRGDAFLQHSAKLEQSSIPILNEIGSAALLLLRPAQVVPLLKAPDIRRIVWFAPQGRLARLDPSLELDILSRFGAGTEGKERELLLRFRDVPGESDERSVTAAGYRIVTRAGPNLVVSGPLSAVPKLLAIDGMIYLEKASNP